MFASQVAYVATGSGVALGMLIYDERHSPWFWAALALMFAGPALVRPKRCGGAVGCAFCAPFPHPTLNNGAQNAHPTGRRRF